MNANQTMNEWKDNNVYTTTIICNVIRIQEATERNYNDYKKQYWTIYVVVARTFVQFFRNGNCESFDGGQHNSQRQKILIPKLANET